MTKSIERATLKRSVWVRVALLNAELSTCLRLQVGCVLLDSVGKVIGTGYNGSLPGRVHCTPDTCNAEKRCMWTQHAERNALDVSTGAVHSAFVTHEPCIQCTKDLLSRGCKFVYFLHPYTMKEDEKEWRDKHALAGNMEIKQIDITGCIINTATVVSYFAISPSPKSMAMPASLSEISDKKCEHNWKYDGLGGGHNGQYYHKCSKCHERDWFGRVKYL